MEMEIGLTGWRPAARHATGLPTAGTRRQRNGGALVDEVARRLGLDDADEAVPPLLAVLQPLLGCLGLADAAQLEATLPGRLRKRLRHDHPILGVSFQPPDRFLAELAGRNGIDVTTAAIWTRAVCAALADELPPGVVAGIRAQVPALVRTFFPAGERLAPRLPERAHRCQESPPLWSEIERPVPSYLMFASGDPITGRATEGVAGADGHPSIPVLPQETHVPTHPPVTLERPGPP